MTGNELNAQQTNLFTLKGLIAVHLMDGDVIEGEFATQDAYNVFVSVDDQPRMISRVQIRWIGGLQGQQIQRDESQRAIEDPLGTQPMLEPTDTEPVTEIRMPVTPPTVVDQVEPDLAPEEPELEEAIIAEPDTIEPEQEEAAVVEPEVTEPEPEEDDDEDAGTLILVAEETADSDEEEEDGTVVLSDSDEILAALAAAEEQPVVEDEEIDMTMVLGRDVEIPEFMQEDELFATDPIELTTTLICISGPHEGEVFKLDTGISSIGRSTDNVVVLNRDKEISRRHAIILQESGRNALQDQNSLNGTLVNDEQISSPRYLQNGDVILVGVSSLRFEES
jgi:hypothetical protein